MRYSETSSCTPDDENLEELLRCEGMFEGTLNGLEDVRDTWSTAGKLALNRPYEGDIYLRHSWVHYLPPKRRYLGT